MLRHAPTLAILVLIGPILFGLLSTLGPAFGYFPALGGNGLTLAHFDTFWGTPGVPKSIALSLTSGLATTAISLAITFAFVAAWSGTRAFARMQHFISPLLSVPHAAAAFGLAFLIAPSGYLMRLASPWLTGFDRPPDWLIVGDANGLAMIAGLVVKEVPFLLLVTLAALPQTGGEPAMRIARSLGYGRMAAFAFVIWPQVYPQIRLAIFAVIAYATSVVDVATILGPNLPSTLAVRLTQWMSDADTSLRFVASAGALVQLATTVVAIGLWIAGEQIACRVARHLRRSGRRFASDAALRGAAMAAMTLCALTVFGGLALLALWSVAGLWSFPDALPDSFTLRTWMRVQPTLVDPLWTTITVGLVSTGIAVAIALACLEREARTGRTGGARALWLLYLPLLVPQVSFVFGLQLFFISTGWDATWAALVLVHLVFVLPYVFLSLSDPWRAFDPRFVGIATGLGASRNRTFWQVRLPMLAKPALTATAVGFAVSVGQYLPTLLVGAGRHPTITTKAVALASGGDRRVLGVYAFLQMVLPFIAFVIATAGPALAFRNRRAMRASA